MEQLPSAQEVLVHDIGHELAEILGSAELAGFGANGFVFRVPGERISSRLAESLLQLGEKAIPDTVAMKMLKVSEPGLADHEVSMQQTAWNILRDVSTNPKYASVARVYFSHTAHFGQADQQHLTELGFKVGSIADVISMDFIEGRDLREILAEQVMQRSEGAQPYQIQRTTDPDSDYRYEFLKKRGFSVHPSIADRIERTMKALHEGGLYHRDLHEGNIMISGDPTSSECGVHIIDFGAADVVGRPEYDSGAVDDMMVVRRIREHQRAAEGAPSEDETDWLDDVKRLHALANGHQVFELFRASFLSDREKALSGLRVIDERSLSRVAVQLLGLLDAKLLSVEDARSVITRLHDECRFVSVKRKLHWLRNYVSSIE
jgi:tRNA A-37 threonylcarbamoyl transferase component Bud32